METEGLRQSRKLGYARVSTSHQGTDAQVAELRQAGCSEIVVERCSGARADRPELARLLARLQPGDVLVVTRLDRLGRSLPHLLETVNGLAQRGVGFHCLHQPVNTTDATGRLVLGILGALAEFERELLRERVRGGIEAARERGRKLGRPLTLSPERIAAAQGMLAGGASVSHVARVLGVSRTTLYRRRESLEV